MQYSDKPKSFDSSFDSDKSIGINIGFIYLKFMRMMRVYVCKNIGIRTK